MLHKKTPCGGYLSDARSCFASDGRFFLSPIGPYLAVIDTSTGRRVFSTSEDSQASRCVGDATYGNVSGEAFSDVSPPIIVSVERFEIEDVTREYFVTLDTYECVRVYEWVDGGTKAGGCRLVDTQTESPLSPSPRLKKICELDGRVVSRQLAGSGVSSSERRVVAAHASGGFSKSFATAEIVFLVEDRRWLAEDVERVEPTVGGVSNRCRASVSDLCPEAVVCENKTCAASGGNIEQQGEQDEEENEGGSEESGEDELVDYHHVGKKNLGLVSEVLSQEHGGSQGASGYLHVFAVSFSTVLNGTARAEDARCVLQVDFGKGQSAKSNSGYAVSGRYRALRSAVSGSYIVVTWDKALCVWDSVSGQVMVAHHTVPFSAVAIHPDLQYVVTGDVVGHVMWWHVLAHKEVKVLRDGVRAGADTAATGVTWGKRGGCNQRLIPTRCARATLWAVGGSGPEMGGSTTTVSIPVAIQHWHAHSVRALAFTANGIYLVSAGEEAVLVFWHTHEHARHYMPRFGAPIRGISPVPAAGFGGALGGRGAFIAVAVADNSLRFVDTAACRVVAQFEGVYVPLSLLQGGTLEPAAFRVRKKDICPIIVNPLPEGSGSNVVIAASGLTSDGIGASNRFQIYDLDLDVSRGRCSVNQQNYVSRTDSRVKKFQWTLQKVAVSPNCGYFATVEYRRSMFPARGDELLDSFPSHFPHGSIGSSQGGPLVLFDQQEAGGRKAGVSMAPFSFRQGAIEATSKGNKGAYGFFNEQVDSRSEQEMNFGHLSMGMQHGAFRSGKYYLMKFCVVGDGTGSSSAEEKHLLSSDESVFMGGSVYSVVTEVEEPHTHDVTALLCLSTPNATSSPVSLEVNTVGGRQRDVSYISTSLDGYWKLWVPRRSYRAAKASENRLDGNCSAQDVQVGFTCGFSGTFRGLPILTAALSEDGSLLALCHPKCVSVWDVVKQRRLGIVSTGLPVSQAIPLQGTAVVSWITAVASSTTEQRWSKNSTVKQSGCDGRRFLMVGVGPHLRLWNLETFPGRLVWCDTVVDASSIVIPNIWGKPFIGVMSREKQEFYVMKIVNHGENVTCEAQKASRISLGLGPQRLIFGFSFFGTAHAPQFAVVDSCFVIHRYPVLETDYATVVCGSAPCALAEAGQPISSTGEMDSRESTVGEDLYHKGVAKSAETEVEVVCRKRSDDEDYRSSGVLFPSRLPDDDASSQAEDLLSAFIRTVSKPMVSRAATDPQHFIERLFAIAPSVAAQRVKPEGEEKSAATTTTSFGGGKLGDFHVVPPPTTLFKNMMVACYASQTSVNG